MESTTTRDLQDLIEQLRAAKEGNDPSRVQHIIGAILERAFGRIRGVAAVILRSYPKVKDERGWGVTEVTDEAIVRLTAALQTVDLNNPKHFFRLAAKKIRLFLIDEVRRLPEGRRAAREEPPPVGLERPQHDFQDVLARLLELLQDLPEEQYAVLDLAIVFGFNDREIAADLEVNEKTVRNRRRRAYEIIANHLRAEFPSLGEGLASGQ